MRVGQALVKRKPQGVTVTGGTVHIKVPRNHSGQQIMEDHMARFNVAQCGRRLGKTTFMRRRAMKTILSRKSYGLFGPTYKLVSDSWRDLCKRLGPITKDKSEQERRLETIHGGVLECWTLDGPDAGRGRDYDEVGIEEAGLVKELQERWEADIRPTLVVKKGGAWFPGTPKGRRFFHKLFERGQENMLTGVGDWAAFRMPSILNPRVTLKEIDDARRELPDNVFRQEFLGEPDDDGGNPFGLLAIAACCYKVYETTGTEPFKIPFSRVAKKRYCAGIDVARAEDYTVVYIMDVDTGECVYLDRFRLPWEATLPRIAHAINEYGATYTIDATGVGDKVARDVMKLCRPVGELFVFTSPSKQGLMERLMTCLHKREVLYPRGWLVAELENFGYEYTKHGVRYEAPQGLHDDGVMALALAVHCRDRARIAAGQSTDNFPTVRR